MNNCCENVTDLLPRLLVVEDELSMRQLLSYIFDGENYQVTTAATGQEACRILQMQCFDIILQDVMLPDIEGLVLLNQIKQEQPKTIVIVITAVVGWKTAVEAMRLGAFDYIKKPFDNKNIRMVVQRALQYKKSLDTSLKDVYTLPNLIGNSPHMQKIQELIRRMAPTDATILVYGESGCGKELVARAIHMNSMRRENVFIPVNCGAIAESLIESELFGYVRGAFTGAVNNKKGLFEVAHCGTLFLDEIGEMSLSTQVKLLRVLEEKEFIPLGGNVPHHADVRFVSATNRNLDELVKKGDFREDLYYRMNVMPIQIPPLRERKEDIPLLAGHFLSLHASHFHKQVVRFSDAAMERVLNYDWPGNIRELGNLIQRAVLMCEGEVIETKDIAGYIPYTISTAAGIYPDLPDEGIVLDDRVAEFELFYIKKALQKTNGHMTNAAKLLHMSFRGLRYKVKKYNLKNCIKEG
jgi:two-component system response regulator PilR (NtrC family)